MKLFPSDSFEIHTDLPPEQVVELLRSETIPRDKISRCRVWSALHRSDRHFYGKVWKDGFELISTPTFFWHNSFTPRMRGTVRPTEGGTVVTVDMELHRSVRIFMGFAFIFILLHGVLWIPTCLLMAVAGKYYFLLTTPGPVVMLLAFRYMPSFSFWWDAPTHKQRLRQLVHNGRIDEQPAGPSLSSVIERLPRHVSGLAKRFFRAWTRGRRE